MGLRVTDFDSESVDEGVRDGVGSDEGVALLGGVTLRDGATEALADAAVGVVDPLAPCDSDGVAVADTDAHSVAVLDGVLKDLPFTPSGAAGGKGGCCSVQ